MPQGTGSEPSSWRPSLLPVDRTAKSWATWIRTEGAGPMGYGGPVGIRANAAEGPTPPSFMPISGRRFSTAPGFSANQVATVDADEAPWGQVLYQIAIAQRFDFVDDGRRVRIAPEGKLIQLLAEEGQAAKSVSETSAICQPVRAPASGTGARLARSDRP